MAIMKCRDQPAKMPVVRLIWHAAQFKYRSLGVTDPVLDIKAEYPGTRDNFNS